MFSTICTLLLLSLYVGYITTANQPIVITWSSDINGPARNLLCGFPDPCNTCTFKWISSTKILAEDDKLIDADSSRYHVNSGICHSEQDLCGSLLQITNLIKDDEGSYTCEVRNGTHLSQGVGTVDDIAQYLPPITYPQCRFHSGLNSNNMETVTFNCTGGQAYPPVNLVLTVKRQDGQEEILTVELDKISAVTDVTHKTSNDIFICHMTSHLFTNFYRNCMLNLSIP